VFETRDKTTLNHRSTTFIIIIEHSGDGFIVVIIVYTDLFIILTLYICKKKKKLNGWVRPFLIQTLSETTQLFQSAIDYKHRPKRGCGDKIFMMI